MSTTTETRKESILKINETLGERQEAILRFIDGKEPMTAREIALGMYEKGLLLSPERNMVHPRLNELVKMNLIIVDNKKKDEVMNRMVATYSIK